MARRKLVNVHKQALVMQLSSARNTISSEREVLKQKLQENLQPKRQLKKIVSANPKIVFVGSVITGLLVTRLLTKKRERKQMTVVKKSKTLTLLVWAGMLAKPLMKSWVKKNGAEFVKNQLEMRSNRRAQVSDSRNRS